MIYTNYNYLIDKNYEKMNVHNHQNGCSLLLIEYNNSLFIIKINAAKLFQNLSIKFKKNQSIFDFFNFIILIKEQYF